MSLFNNYIRSRPAISSIEDNDLLLIVRGSVVTIITAAEFMAALQPASYPANMIAQDATHRLITDAERSAWNALRSVLIPKGIWNAATNTPPMPPASPDNNGWCFIVAVPGNTEIDGISSWNLWDTVTSNGEVWQRVPGNELNGHVLQLAGETLPERSILNFIGDNWDVADTGAVIEVAVKSPVMVVSDTPPPNLPIGGIWIDASQVERYAPSISSIPLQAFIYTDGLADLPVSINDVQDVLSCELSAISGDTEWLPANAITFGGTGRSRTLSISTRSEAGAALITVIVTNLYGLQGQISFNAVGGAQLFTITTSAGANGSITPTVDVAQGGSITITATPDDGYGVAQLVIDSGTPLTGVTFYTFNNVQENHTVHATFAVNATPTISAIADQLTSPHTATSAISFTIGDPDTSVGSLLLDKASSNTTLLPLDGIVFGGSGQNRTVTCTPAAGNVGTCTVTITVSDGHTSAQETFVLTVAFQYTTLWHFDNDVVDAMGYRNGTPTAITYETGVVNQAAVFNGTTSKVALAAPLITSNIWTIKAAFKTTKNTGEQYIYSEYDASVDTYGIDIRLYLGRIYVKVKSSSGEKYVLSNAAFSDGLWHTIVAVSNTASTVVVYVDNVLLTNATSGTGNVGAQNLTAPNIGVGCLWGAENGIHWFQGSIDEIGILNGFAATAEEAVLLVT